MINSPLKRGTIVKIKKGTACWSTNPDKKKFVAGRTYNVTIADSYPGFDVGDQVQLPEVVWVGTGGYWTYAKVSDVEVVNPELRGETI